MSKRRAPDASQMGFTFEPQVAVVGPAAFAGADAWVAAEVGRALKGDPRSREEIAGAMSASLADEVSRWMLDAYASPARDTHNISFGRALALMAVTKDHSMIERAVAQLGGSVLWGEEIHTARLGHLKAQRARLDDEIKQLRVRVQPIDRGRS